MQAIVTRYYPPTNTKGPRVRAYCSAGTLSILWHPDMEIVDNHARAARVLFRRLNWHETSKILGGGDLPNGNGMAWVLEAKAR